MSYFNKFKPLFLYTGNFEEIKGLVRNVKDTFFIVCENCF